MSRGSTEIFDCDRVNAYLDSYLLGQVPPPERRGMRLHIHRCPACFQKASERDPLQLFAPLADQERPEATWEGFWPAIREGIEREETRRLARRKWLSAAALAIVVTSVGLIATRYLVRRAEPVPVAMAGRTTVTPPPPERHSAAAPLPQTVERVRTEGSREVQIYTMNYYDQPAAATLEGAAGPGRLTELVLIVDAGIEL
ncbi:MAG TPA: zf-HC2 domain-containing protein [Candidatus Polarisedimenticolia bacterium]|jgi:hypothetical protein